MDFKKILFVLFSILNKKKKKKMEKKKKKIFIPLIIKILNNLLLSGLGQKANGLEST
jgi:hypothetical protein